MTKKEYEEIILRWRTIFEVSKESEKGKFDPVSKKAVCIKCGNSRAKMHRHHKACDFMFALLDPFTFAKRYLEFRPEDIDLLCGKCHRKFHFWIKEYQDPLLFQANYLKQQGKLTKSWLLKQHKRMTRLYESWRDDKPVRYRKNVRRKGTR